MDVVDICNNSNFTNERDIIIIVVGITNDRDTTWQHIILMKMRLAYLHAARDKTTFFYVVIHQVATMGRFRHEPTDYIGDY